MAETTNRKSEPVRRWTGGFGPWAFCLLTPALWFLPAGCAPDDFASNDPLFGGPPVRPPTGPGAGSIQPVAATVPSLPQPAPSGTPAALTGASRGPLDPNRGELHIGSDTGSPTWQPSGVAPAVALQPPQPASGGGPVPLQPKAIPEAQPTAIPTGPGYEQVWAQLTQRGVSRLVIVPDGKDVLWSCVVPSKSEPGKQQHYEVRNPHDPVSALQALLEKIDKG